MQGINAGEARYPKCSFGSGLFQSLLLIVVSNNKTAEHKKETDSDKPFFKEMSIET